MKPLYQRILLITGTAILLLLAAFCGYKIHVLSQKHEELKKDYSVVNGIGNGLLSVTVWRDEIIKAANHKIETFEFTEEQRDTLRYEIRKILQSVITKAEKMLEEEKAKTLGGKIKKFAAKTFIDEDEIREKVPEFAQTIEHALMKKESRQKLKYLVKSKLQELGAETYDSSNNEATMKKLIAKHGADNIDSFNKKIEQQSDTLKDRIYTYTFITIGVLIVFILLWVWLRKNKVLRIHFFVISVILALVVLLVGLTTPMIEIDARIKSLNFHVIGETITFDDQVIFFQSKSIVDVVHIMLKTGKYDSVLVGILILVFSILFPVSKLFSAGMYLLGNKKWKNSKLVRFFAFKSGKWSMADVNVIAIFMAYIGFKGILDDQMQSLNVKTEALTSISTNQTSLMPGYIIFVGFVLFGLILSFILEKLTGRDPDVAEV